VYKGGYEKQHAQVKYFSYLVLHHFDLDDGKGRKALDVGCAYGYTVEVFLELGYDVYGCDISTYAINKANKLHNWKRRFVMDIQNTRDIRKISVKYHLITMFNTIEHIHDIESTLLNIKYLLDKEGILLVQTVNPLNPFFLLDNDPTHINVHSPLYWKKIFSKYFSTVIIRNYQYFHGKLLIPCPLLGYITIIIAK
jgi:2-polyprenyl-3-methyl-5-hydroxy-6-metoxy-1,4-benzoquinol methylase